MLSMLRVRTAVRICPHAQRIQVVKAPARVHKRVLSGQVEGGIQSRPPRVVRALLVGSSVGLATPAYVIAAVFQAWYRVAPRSDGGRATKFIIGTLMGGGCFKLVSDYVGPFIRDHSELILPFALSNAVMSSFWYVTGESVLGLDMMMGATWPALAEKAGAGLFLGRTLAKLPFAGTAVGALTAVTVPLLWPMMFDLCWDQDLQELILGKEYTQQTGLMKKNWLVDIYTNWTMAMVVPVGAGAGATMHLLLRNYAMGTPGVPWTKNTLPPLAGVLVASALYFTLFRTEINDWWWVERIDPKDGTKYSYNFREDKSEADDGRLATIAGVKRSCLQYVHWIRDIGTIFWGKEEQTNYYEKRKKRVHNLEEANPSLLTVEERAILFSLVDRLLRLKALDQEFAERKKNRSAEPFAEEEVLQEKRTALMSDARDRKLCFDLGVVLQAVEVGVASVPDSSNTNTNREPENARRLKEVKKTLTAQTVTNKTELLGLFDGFAYEDPKHRINEYRMLSLYRNLPLVKKEMKARLDYEPDLATVDALHRSMRTKNFLDGALFKTSVVAIAGAVVVALLNR